MGVSENGGTPKSSISIGFSIINLTIHFGVPPFSETPIYMGYVFIMFIIAVDSNSANQWYGYMRKNGYGKKTVIESRRLIEWLTIRATLQTMAEFRFELNLPGNMIPRYEYTHPKFHTKKIVVGSWKTSLSYWVSVTFQGLCC